MFDIVYAHRVECDVRCKIEPIILLIYGPDLGHSIHVENGSQRLLIYDRNTGKYIVNIKTYHTFKYQPNPDVNAIVLDWQQQITPQRGGMSNDE